MTSITIELLLEEGMDSRSKCFQNIDKCSTLKSSQSLVCRARPFLSALKDAVMGIVLKPNSQSVSINCLDFCHHMPLYASLNQV